MFPDIISLRKRARKEDIKSFIEDVLIALYENPSIWMYPSDFLQAMNAILYNSNDIHADLISIAKMYLLMKYVAPEREFAPEVRKLIGMMIFDSDAIVPPDFLMEFAPEFLEAVHAYHYDFDYTDEVEKAVSHYREFKELPQELKNTYAETMLEYYENALEILKQRNPLEFIGVKYLFPEATEEEMQEAIKEVQKDWPHILSELEGEAHSAIWG